MLFALIILPVLNFTSFLRIKNMLHDDLKKTE